MPQRYRTACQDFWPYFEMFDSTSKIASINSFREPDSGTSSRGQKRKPQPQPAALSVPATKPSDSDDVADEHELDTLA